jgi:hypothetical protein
MAAFETTPVAIPRADQPTIVQRFLVTSERYLFHPPAAALVLVRAHIRGTGVLHDHGRLCLPLPRGSQTGAQGRAAA